MPSLSLKYFALLALVLLGIGFAFGRYAAPTRVTESSDTKTAIEDHSVIKRERKVNVDGSVSTITVVEKNVEKQSEQTKEKETIRSSPMWQVGAIVGTQLNSSLPAPLFGVSVSHRFIGPIFLGAQAIKLNNGAFVGASLGLEF